VARRRHEPRQRRLKAPTTQVRRACIDVCGSWGQSDTSSHRGRGDISYLTFRHLLLNLQALAWGNVKHIRWAAHRWALESPGPSPCLFLSGSHSLSAQSCVRWTIRENFNKWATLINKQDK
jgi:hypothetical protein